LCSELLTLVSPALLTPVHTDLAFQQKEIADTLKQHCPGFAAMRKLALSFRNILRLGEQVGSIFHAGVRDWIDENSWPEHELVADLPGGGAGLNDAPSVRGLLFQWL
jgi:hypothetical protein